jgi:hypothetical protein
VRFDNNAFSIISVAATRVVTAKRSFRYAGFVFRAILPPRIPPMAASPAIGSAHAGLKVPCSA